jgi:hypothetical protein
LAAGGYSRSMTGSTAGSHKRGFRAAKIRTASNTCNAPSKRRCPPRISPPLNPGSNKAEE